MRNMHRYGKLSQSMVAMLLLFSLGGVMIVNLLMPGKSFSEAENRSLEQLPKLSFRSLVSGKFTSGFEKYISDQFMARDFWIGVKSDADRAMGKKESNGVYLGKDGYLIQKFNPPADGDLENKVTAIYSLSEAAPGLRTFVMLVPTAVSVLADKLPDFAPAGGELAYLDQVKRSLQRDIRFVDVYPALHAQRERSVYYKTDHHWTTRGAFYAYQELSKRMGLTPKREEDFTIRQVTDEFYGSLYSKSGFRPIEPDSIELYMPKKGESFTVEYVEEGRSSDSLYAMDNLGKKDKYAVFFGGNHSLIRITTGLRDGTKLLAVKDSYANSLIPFLTAHFSEIYIVDPRYYEEDLKGLIQEHQIRDVLLLYNANTFFEDPSLNQLAGGAGGVNRKGGGRTMASLFAKANMRRLILLLVITTVFAAVMIGCSGKPEGVRSEVTVGELAQRLKQVVKLDELKQRDKETLQRLYHLGGDEVEDFVLFTAVSNVKADEVAVIQVKDAAQVERAMQQVSKRIDAQTVKFKDYRPEEYALVQKHVLKREGRFVLFAVSKDADRLEQVFDEALRRGKVS